MGPVIFLHIPKTGGMTFASIITRGLPQESVLQIDGTLASCAEQLNRLPEKTRTDIQCIYGHVPFGLHRCLSHPATYITLLRNPVDRVASAYYYALRRPEWGFHELIVKQHLSLDEFVTSEAAAELHNAQARMLSGSDEPVGGVDTLDTAKANLRQRLAFVGLTERFDESVMLCRALLGLGSGFYLSKNINRHRVPFGQIPSRTVALIEDRNSLDLELYDAARREFDLLTARFPGLPGQLARFRRWNACYGLAGYLLGLPFNLFRDTKAAIRRAQVEKPAHSDQGWWAVRLANRLLLPDRGVRRIFQMPGRLQTRRLSRFSCTGCELGQPPLVRVLLRSCESAFS